MIVQNQTKPSINFPGCLNDFNKIAKWIADLTNQPPETVKTRLRREFDLPGSTVAAAVKSAGITPHVWSDAMADFYNQTDAFLYELVIWNRNQAKAQMRRAVANHLAKIADRPLKLLNIGDGLGFDTVALANLGHDVTYFELPGLTQQFATRVFEDANLPITILTDPESIPHEHYDALICLDVLEHVPDPQNFVAQLVRYIRPMGHLVVNAPFMLIQKANPTHLRANRKHSGSLKLYKQNGLTLIDGEPVWNPIVLQKTEGQPPTQSPHASTIAKLKLTGLLLTLARYPIIPFKPAELYVRKLGVWFNE